MNTSLPICEVRAACGACRAAGSSSPACGVLHTACRSSADACALPHSHLVDSCREQGAKTCQGLGAIGVGILRSGLVAWHAPGTVGRGTLAARSGNGLPRSVRASGDSSIGCRAARASHRVGRTACDRSVCTRHVARAMTTAAVLTVAIVAIAALLRWHAARLRRKVRSLDEVFYRDTADGRERPAPLVSRRIGLVGRPDYLVSKSGRTIPIEVKSGIAPASGVPHRGHLLQLVAYCILVEDALRRRVRHGIVRYRDRDLRVSNSWLHRRAVRRTVERIRQAPGDVARSHREPGRCRHCGFRDDCGQSLV